MNIVQRVSFQLSCHILIMLVGFIATHSVTELFYDAVIYSQVLLHVLLIVYVNSEEIMKIQKIKIDRKGITVVRKW